MRTEITAAGPKAATQLDRLRGLLKDAPQKHSLRERGLLLEETPALAVVHNPSVDQRSPPAPLAKEDEDEEEEACRGYHPGPHEGRSLKLSSNVIPIAWERDTTKRQPAGDFR